MRKAVKIGFIGVFCAVIGLAFPVFNIFSKQLSMDSHENRLMTGLPDGRVVLEPFAEGNHNYLSEDAATAAALDKALRETTVAFLVEFLK